MSNMPAANYAENLIDERLGGFRFQQREGALNMKAISSADVSQIVERGDYKALRLLLNTTNIINADVSGEDFDFHSSDFLVKLFQTCQLSLELSHTTNDTLMTELYSKATEAVLSAKNLRIQDEAVAMLRDELYHCKKELKKKAEEQPPSVTRIEHSMFPSQERRRVDSNSTDVSVEDDAATEPSCNDSAEIKLHIVSPSHGLYIPLIVDETCTIRNLQNKMMARCFLFPDGEGEGFSIDFKQLSLYYKDQELRSTGTLKEHHITSDSALCIRRRLEAVSSSHFLSLSPIESKLDDIKSMLNQVTNTLDCQAAIQESNTELLVKGMGSYDEVLEEELQLKSAERVGDVTSPPLSKLNANDLKSPWSEANDDEQNVSQQEMKQTTKLPNACFDTEYETDDVSPPSEKMELKVDTIESNNAGGEEWPFGLNFNTNASPPSEINVTNNMADQMNGKTPEDVKSPPREICCDCLGKEVCDECVNASSPRSSEAVAFSGQQFTFSQEFTEIDTADYDYSCDKSDFESLQIGAKESNVVSDSDLQSIEISLEEFALGLKMKEDKKKKSRILQRFAFKPKWKKIKNKKQATPMDF